MNGGSDLMVEGPPYPEPYLKILRGGLVKGGRGRAEWAKDGSGLWYESVDGIRLFDASSGDILVELDAAPLRDRLSAFLEARDAQAPLPLESFRLEPSGAVRFELAGQAFGVDPASGDVRRIAAAGNARKGTFKRDLFMFPGFPTPDAASPDGRLIASVKDGDLVLTDVGTGQSRAVTQDAVDRFGWDLEGRRLDVLNMKAVQVSPWAPTSRHLFAMRLDRRSMQQAPEYLPLAEPFPQAVMRDWWTAGGPEYAYHPAIVDVEGGPPRPITGIEDGPGFVLLLGWSDDGASVWFAKFSSDFSRIDIHRAGADTARARLVHREQGAPGLRSPHQIFYAGNAGFLLLPGDKGFLWLSERDGTSQIHRHDPTGRFLGQLTRGTGVVETIVAYDPATDSVLYTARSDPDHPYDVHVHRIPLAGGATGTLTEGRGLHDSIRLSPDGRFFVDQFSSPVTPPRTELRTIDGRLVKLLDEADISDLQAIGWQPPLEFTVKAADGLSDVHGVMYRPFDFDPAQRYPVIESIYGGPPMIWADKVFAGDGGGAANHPMALAQLGYLVVKFDTPGTPGRSRDFRMAVVDRWGPGLAEDHAAVILNLGRAYPYVDTERVGIFGHSWGGYNALMALATQGHVYKAAVATAPGGTHGEQYDKFMQAYHGTPAENPEPWVRSDLFRHLDRIDRPLMLGVGTQDYGLLPFVMKISDRLIRRGFVHELVLAPGLGHGIFGAHERYFIEKVTRFFLTHVPVNGAPGRPS